MGHSPPPHSRYNSRGERLELVGQIASELAHSLNNSLNSMQLRLSLLRDETQGSELTNQVDNLSRIVADTASKISILQEFIARGVTQVETVDLRAVLETAARLLREEYASTRDEVRLMLEVPSTLPGVRGNHHDLVSLFVVLFHYLLDSYPAGHPTLVLAAKLGEQRVTVELRQHSSEPHTPSAKRAFDPFAAMAESPLAVSIIAMQGRIKQYGGSLAFADNIGKPPALMVELACQTALSK